MQNKENEQAEDTILSNSDKAAYYYANGFNCSQAILASFATELGMTEEMALKIGTQFGGGARKGEMCGAVSGALMVLGLKYGHYHFEAPDEKANAYGIAVQYMDRFTEKNSTVVCRELLGYDLTKAEDMKVIKKQNLFKTKCPDIIQSAVSVLEEIISKN